MTRMTQEDIEAINAVPAGITISFMHGAKIGWTAFIHVSRVCFTNHRYCATLREAIEDANREFRNQAPAP